MNFKFLLTRKSLDIFFRGVFSFCINVLPLTTDSPRGDSGQSVCICILLFYEHNSEERGRNKTKERVTVNNISQIDFPLFVFFLLLFYQLVKITFSQHLLYSLICRVSFEDCYNVAILPSDLQHLAGASWPFHFFFRFHSFRWPALSVLFFFIS